MQRLSIRPLQLAMRSSMQHVGTRRAPLSTRAAAKKTTTTTTTTTAQHLKKPAAAAESDSGNPELPKFSLDGLGIGKNMKIFLVVVLSIFGTMETWFYCKAIWRWWYGEQGLAVTVEEK